MSHSIACQTATYATKYHRLGSFHACKTTVQTPAEIVPDRDDLWNVLVDAATSIGAASMVECASLVVHGNSLHTSCEDGAPGVANRLRNWGPGLYRTTMHDVIVSATLELGGECLASLPFGTIIEILEVVYRPCEHRLRGLTEAGWISLLNTEDGSRWVTRLKSVVCKVSAESGRERSSEKEPGKCDSINLLDLDANELCVEEGRCDANAILLHENTGLESLDRTESARNLSDFDQAGHTTWWNGAVIPADPVSNLQPPPCRGGSVNLLDLEDYRLIDFAKGSSWDLAMDTYLADMNAKCESKDIKAIACASNNPVVPDSGYAVNSTDAFIVDSAVPKLEPPPSRNRQRNSNLLGL